MKQRFSKRTRLVSALLMLAMVFTFLPFSAFAAGGTHANSTIELSSSNFPDDAFREYLKQFAGIDKKLQPAERNGVKEIDVSGGYNGQKITNLKGIEFFPNLEILYCYNNKLTSLDVSKNPALEYLDASGNQIDINVEETSRTFDLSTLPGFDMNKVINLNGGTVKDNTLTVNENATEVTYDYNCGKGFFALNVNVVPDSTPGGGSTGGSTGGGTVPPMAPPPPIRPSMPIGSWWDNPLSHCFAMPAPPKGELIAAFW